MSTIDWHGFEGQTFTYKYHLLTLLGQGGDGAVFQAQEFVGDRLFRTVAIKLIPDLDQDRVRQEQELELATRLRHPSLVTAYSPEYGELGGQCFWGLVMELAQQSLTNRLRPEPGQRLQVLDPDALEQLVQDVTAGLAFLHTQQPQRLIHRDIKPGNLLWIDGHWKIADFGIVRPLATDQTSDYIPLNTQRATWQYVPPEFYEQNRVHPAWDWWSLGVVIAEAASGKFVFGQYRTREQLRQLITTTDPKIPQGLPEALEKIVQGCLIKDPERRWGAEQIQQILNPSTATRPSVTERRLSSDLYEHPFDRQALNALKRIPAFPFVVRKMNELGFDRLSRIACTGSYLRITPHNFPDLYQIFEQACHTLAIAQPPLLYVQPEGSTGQGFATGVKDPILVINRYAVDSFSSEELLFLLGRGLGYIKSNHVLYFETASYFPVLAQAIGNLTFNVGSLATSGVEWGLLHWSRMAAFTADRAGLLACQDMQVATKALVKLAGLPNKYVDQVVLDDFIAQAREFQDYDYDYLDKMAKFLSTLNKTHPWTVLRTAELLKWIDSGDYAQALGHFITESSMPVRVVSPAGQPS